jgi:hypothetical protein
MVNWKTTVFGALAAILPYLRGAVPPEYSAIVDAASALAIALLGLFAADKPKPSA